MTYSDGIAAYGGATKHAPPGSKAGQRLPSLYDVVVTHVRRERVRRRFTHRIYLWLVDLDELPRLPRWLWPFARFDSADHLGHPARSIRANVDSYLARQGIKLTGGRILMLANARVLGHVFNPITVYWCYRAEGRLECIVAEVHNTYRERHCYLLRPDEAGRADADKEFYVSPFLHMGGTYLMRFSAPGDRLSISISLRQHGMLVFMAGMHGSRRPATRRQLLAMLLRRPLISQRVSTLIRMHGIILWLRRMPIIVRPAHIPQEGVQ